MNSSLATNQSLGSIFFNHLKKTDQKAVAIVQPKKSNNQNCIILYFTAKCGYR